MAKREFAQHINRQKPAKEMRNEVAVSIRHRGTQLEGTNTDEPSQADKLLDTGAWPAYLNDPPPAYEKLLKSSEISNKIARDPLRNQLLLFPDDDWSLVRLKQEFRTVEIPVAPTFRKPTMSMDEIPAELRQCATAYLCDSFRVERKYVEHTQNFEKEMSPVETTLSTFGCDEEQEDKSPDPNRLSYMSRQLSSASSDLDLAKDQDDLAVWMLNWNAKESSKKYQKARQTLQDRVPLLSTLDTQEGRKFRLRRLGADIAPFQDPSLTATKFLVSLAPLEIYNPAVAPELMYSAVCLYDCKQEKQISEMYYTNLTSDSTLREMLLANVKDAIRLKEELKETLTKKRMESKGANMVRDLILPTDPDRLTLSDLLPNDEASLRQDEETVKLATLDPKLLEDDLSRQVIEYAAMRQIIRKYRRETYAKAIFSISQESYDDVFIMIRIEKILEGDPTKAFDLYCKASGADDSAIKRASSIVEEHKDKRKELKVGEQQKARRDFVNRFYRRLGDYRMPFAWAAVPLLDAASICVGELQPAVEPDIYQQVGEKQTDDELFRTLQDLAKKSAERTITKKLKKIPGSLKVKAVKLGTGVHVPRTLTSGLLRVKPWEEEGKDVSLEIREFPAAPVRIPHTTYRHDLFVYPKSILFENSKFRNIACTVEYLESAAEPTTGAQEKSTTGVRRIYDRCCQAEKLTSITTPINYHTKTPAFYEEVKIALPEKITKDHHLLFTFHHIRCKEKQKREKSPSDIIGYAWHPLVNAKNRMKSGELVVSIASEIPAGYLTSGKAKWIDAKKAELCLNIRLDSTVLADDLMVQGFMLSTEEYLTLNTGPSQSAPTNEINLATGVRNLRDADALSLMQFLPVTLNQLIFLLKNCSRGQVLGQEAFIALCHVVATAHEHQSVAGTRSPELSSYIKYVHHIYGFEGRARTNGTGVLHEELLFWLLTAITTYSSNSSRVHETSAYRTCLTHTWFFLELMMKSLAQCLELECKPKLGRNGNLRTSVSQKFIDGLSRVILELVASVTVDDPPDLLVKDWKTRLISAVGFTLRDLFTYIDRSVCFNLIHDVFKLLHAKSANGLNDVTVSFRLDLLEIICSHEHYVPLNLPIEQKLKPHTRLSKEYLQRHYLVGLLLSEVKIMLDSTYSEIRAEAISLVGRVLAMHDKDSRYADEVLRHRVYMLYFPMISIVLEYNAEFSVPHLPDDVVSMDENTTASLARTPIELTEPESVDLLALFLHIISRVKPSTFRSWWRAIVPKSRERLLYLVKLAVYGLSYQGKQSIRVTAAHGDASMGSILRKQLTQNQSQTANALANRYQGGGTGGFTSRAQSNIAARTRPQSAVINTNSQGVAVRKHASNTLRNRSDAAQSMHSGDLRSERTRLATISTGSNARLPVRNAKAMAKISGKSVKLITRYASETSLSHSSISNEERYVKTGLRASEVDLIALDLVDAFIEDFEDQLMIREYKQLLTHLTQVLLAVMRTNVSHGLVVHLFRVLQSFVFRFPKMLFGEDENKEAGRADICGDLCEHTMRFCASRVKSIRELASAFLYLLMRQNFQQKSKKDFARVKVQVTIALSRLLRPSESESIQNIDVNVRRSLATILAFNNKNPSKNYTFPEDVKNLIMNLYTIQRDTSYIREFGESDSEMLIDVHYRIADGYKNSPRIRMEWLKTLSELHTKYDQHAEAGFCMIHSAAILAEKIADFHPREELPKGCVGLVSLSINVLEESLTGDAQKIKDAEDESTFDPDKLEGVLLKALKSFQAARMYEYMISIYKLLIPIYEASKNYEKLQRVYGKIEGRLHGETLTMSECYQLILDEEKQRKRYFGTFYRIGFYCKGELLPPDIRNQEFISREPSLTSLAACSLRLKDQYERYCQSDDVSVEIIQEPHVIDQTKLEPKKVYIQITFVEPCIEQKFGEKRVTIFEQNTSVSSFYFETPFTDSGKSRGDMEHQKLLRTTIKVEKKRSFPYIKKRLKVHSYETITLSPIEFAIDSIEKKIAELEMVVQASEDGVFDLKYLQLKLQGIVMVTVNEGPEAMARVFLSDNPDKPAIDKRLVRKLKQKFKLFLELCEKSLVLNEAHITEDQNEYHATLKGGYERLASAIQPLVSNKPTTVSPSPRTKVVSSIHDDVKPDDSEI